MTLREGIKKIIEKSIKVGGWVISLKTPPKISQKEVGWGKNSNFAKIFVSNQ